MPYRETRRCPTCDSTERLTGARLSGGALTKDSATSPVVAEVCLGCGRVELRATDLATLRTAGSEARDQPAGRDDACLRCGTPMPEAVSVCPACGWSFIT